MLLGIHKFFLILFCATALISILSGTVFVIVSLFSPCSDNAECPCRPARNRKRKIILSILCFIHIGVLVGGIAYGCHFFRVHKDHNLYTAYAHEIAEELPTKHIDIPMTSSETILSWRNSSKEDILIVSIHIMQTHGATQKEITEILTEKFGLTEEEAEKLIEKSLQTNTL